MIRGSKGSKAPKAKAPHVPTEAPNTLQSKNTARIIDSLGEGEIRGLVNGLQSVFFDETPLQNPDGTFNFEGVEVETRVGLPDQDPLAGFPFVEEEIQVGVEVTTDTAIVRTISEPDIDFAMVKIRLDQLNQTNSNGDITDTKVEFNIEVQESGGSYTPINNNYQWSEFTGGESSSSSVVGLRVTAQATISGFVSTTQTATITTQYREVGSGTWLDLGTREVSGIIPSNRSTVQDPRRPGVQNTGSTTVSATFDIDGLDPGQYEVQATAGSIVKSEQMVQTPISISGKTTSAYEAAYRVPLPAGGAPWNIRVTRITADSESVSLRNKTFWSSYTKVIDVKLSYPDTALVGVKFDAQLFGQSVPGRAYEIEGLLIQVPSNYDPETREYTGVWDGTFQTAYSNNPAWVLYDLLTHPRYGLGQSLTADHIDKYALYDIGVYCDELVDDGYGGEEPRFTFNGALTAQRDAYDVINAIVSGFRGMAFWSSGVVSVCQDSPTDPVKLVTNSNVINGDFNYSGTELNSRHSAVLVSWNDPNNAYKSAIAVVEDIDAINQFGWRQTDTAAFGCTSRGQAVRHGRWILKTEQDETENVTYQAGLDHIDMVPGQIFAVADEWYQGARLGGRVVTPGTSTLVLDTTLTLSAGETYNLSVVLPDGTLETKAISNSLPATTATITLASPLSDTPVAGAVWVLTGSSVNPRHFRLISIKENEKNLFEVMGLFHDPNKYAEVEDNLVLEEPEYSLLPAGAIIAPTELNATEYLYQAGPSIKSAVTLSWLPSQDARVSLYEIQYQGPNDSDFRGLRTVSGTSVDLLDTTTGDYTFRVRGVTAFGTKSPFAEMSAELLGLFEEPSDVENFSINIVAEQAFLAWDRITDLDLSHYVLKYSPALSGASWGSAQTLIPRISKDATGVTVPVRVGTYLIKAVDIVDQQSVNEALIITNIAEVLGLNVITVIDEAPDFLGEVSGCSVLDNAIQLTGEDTVDDWTNIDEVVNWDIGNAGITASGTYEFDQIHDNGEVYTCRLTPTIEAIGSDLYDNMDLWEDFDNVENIDGADPSQWEVQLQVKTTDADPNSIDPDVDPEGWEALWSDEWQNLLVGDYTARAFRWRLLLYSYQDGISPIVTGLSVSIDMPDRTAGSEDVVCPGAGLTVTYSPAFKAAPALTISAQGLATGDYYELTSKTASGFFIRFFNAAGTGISKTFDYVAKGYGVQG